MKSGRTKTVPAVPGDWRTTIDGWVRDPAIRSFALKIFVVGLIGPCVTIGLVAGSLTAVIDAVLPSLLAKVIAGGALTSAGGGLWVLGRQRRNARAAAPELSTSTVNSPTE